MDSSANKKRYQTLSFDKACESVWHTSVNVCHGSEESWLLRSLRLFRELAKQI
jgi:hypothetical protein